MKYIPILLLLVSLAVPAAAADLKTGQDVVAAMHKKYDGKWYKTLTFRQETTNFKPDGTGEMSVWYEALSAPGKLRIDFEPLEKRDGILFADGKVYSFRDNAPATGRAFVHPLLVLGFDVYMQPVETTIGQLKAMGVDLSAVHTEKRNGEDVYVVGAKQGDLGVPQFWVTKKNLLFVRLIQLAGRDKKSVQDTEFNKYVKSSGGWVAAEVRFLSDGKLRTTEVYSDIRTGMKLDADLWNPEKWSTVDRSYFKIK